MGFVNELENDVKDFLQGDYEIIDLDYIPSIENISLKKKAYRINMLTFCIDLRGSSKLLELHQKQTAGKIHKAFLTTVVKTIKNYGGRVRDFQGDSILAFWPAKYQEKIDTAIKTAMTIVWLLNQRLSKHFTKYTKLDYGIGIAIGNVYVIRAGISINQNENDLVYIGESVNFAVAIGNQMQSPYHIGISEKTYKRISNDWIYGKKNGYKVSMWEQDTARWKNGDYYIKKTNWFNKLSE